MHLHREPQRMIRPFSPLEPIAGNTQLLSLGPFLQRALRVTQVPTHLVEQRRPVQRHEFLRCRKTSVKIECGNQRFTGITKDGGLAAPACPVFTRRQDNRPIKTTRGSNACTGFHSDKRVELQRQRTLGLFRKILDQHLGNQKPEDAVTQKLKLFVVCAAGAGMGQGTLQQSLVPEYVAEIYSARFNGCP